MYLRKSSHRCRTIIRSCATSPAASITLVSQPSRRRPHDTRRTFRVLARQRQNPLPVQRKEHPQPKCQQSLQPELLHRIPILHSRRRPQPRTLDCPRFRIHLVVPTRSEKLREIGFHELIASLPLRRDFLNHRRHKSRENKSDRIPILL